MTREIIRRNLDIRSAAKNAGVFLYEIAEKLGVSEPTFNRMLRKELDEPTKHKALAAIETIRLFFFGRYRWGAAKSELRSFFFFQFCSLFHI